MQVRSLPDGRWTDWLTGYPYASAIFTGQPGRTYEFRTRARDIAGNVEAYPTNPDISVRINPRHIARRLPGGIMHMPQSARW